MGKTHQVFCYSDHGRSSFQTGNLAVSLLLVNKIHQAGAQEGEWLGTHGIAAQPCIKSLPVSDVFYESSLSYFHSYVLARIGRENVFLDLKVSER